MERSLLNDKLFKVLQQYFPNKKNYIFLGELKNKNNVFLVELNSKKYVVKRYKIGKNIDVDRVNFFSNLQNFTNERLQFFPQVIKTTNQKLYVKQDKEIFQVTEFIKNSDVNTCKTHDHNSFFYDIGVTIGRIHNTFAEYEKNNKIYHQALLKFIPNNPNKHLLKLLGEYKKHNIGDKWQKILIAKMEIMKDYDTSQGIFHKLPTKIVHGDLHIDNLLFNQKLNVIGLIDYTRAGLFFHCYEVIRTFIQTNKHLGNLSINPLNLKKYLKGYYQFCQLNRDELSTMLDLYIFIQASDSSFLCLKAFKKNNKSSLEYGLYRFQSLKHLEKNRKLLIKTIHES